MEQFKVKMDLVWSGVPDGFLHSYAMVGFTAAGYSNSIS